MQEQMLRNNSSCAENQDTDTKFDVIFTKFGCRKELNNF